MQIITLSSDIGQQDFIVGAIKGQLLTACGQVAITDITHYLSQSNFPEAAYLCHNAFSYYPKGSIHVIFLNYFEYNKHHVLWVEHNGQIIVCADNGLITMLFPNKPTKVYKLEVNNNLPFLQVTQNITTAIGLYCRGEAMTEWLTPFDDYMHKTPLKPTIGNGWIKGQIIFIDNFENVVVNITKSIFEEQRQGRKFKIQFKRNDEITEMNDNYMITMAGEKIAWFNSAGYLELAVVKGNMAGLFGLQGFNEIMYKEGKAMQNKWFYQTVTILFE